MVQKLEQQELQVIYESSKHLQSIQAPDVLSQEIIKILEDILNYDFGAVLLINEETQELFPFALSDQGKGADFVEEDKEYVSSRKIKVGIGITGIVAQTGKSILLGDVRKDPRYFSIRDYIRSELCVPVVVGEKIIGVVNTETPRLNAYTETDQMVLEIIASQIGIAVTNSRLFESTLKEIETRQLYQKRLEALHHYNPAIVMAESVPELARITLEMIKKILGFDRVSFLVVVDDYLEQIEGIPTAVFKAPLDGKGITVRTARTGKTQLVPDVSIDPDFVEVRFEVDLPRTRSELCVPVLNGKMVVAVINAESDKECFFTHDDQTILEIVANTISASINHINYSKKLIESEKRYHSLFSDSLEGIIIRNNAGIITAINQAGANIFGYDYPDELIGRPIKTTWAEPDKHSEAVAEVIENGFKKNKEIKTRRKDGSIGQILASANVRYDNNGDVDNVETYFRDISELKQMYESLRESEERYRGLVEDSPFPISVTVDDKIVYVSPERLKLTGHTNMEELIGASGVEYVASEDKAIIQGRIESRKKGEQVSSVYLFKLNKVDGEVIHVIDYMSTILWEGKPAVMHILQDITKQVKYETRLEALHSYTTAIASADTMDQIANITQSSLNDVIGFYLGGLSFVEDAQLVHRNIWGLDSPEPFTLPLDGPGITVEAVNTGKTQNIPNIQDNPLFVDEFASYKTVSELAVPVKVTGKVVAVVNLESKILNAFSEEDQRLVEILASNIASAFSNIKYSERLNLLHDIALTLSYAESVEDVVKTTLGIMREILGFQFISFQLLETEGLVTVGTEGAASRGIVMPLTGKGITVRAAREARTILVGDVRLDPDFIQVSTDSRSELAVPILVMDHVLGVLNVESLQLNAFTLDDARLMEVLAQNVGAALLRIHAARDKLELERQLIEEHIRVEQEQELARLKTRFMSTATHEIRTPLASIMGYTELVQMEEADLSESQRHYFTVILRNVLRLTKLTDDLLDQQRLEEKRVTLNIKPVKIKELMVELENEFTPLLIEKNQSLKVNCVDVTVNLDRLRVMQVLVNLLSNASKFSPKGAVITLDVVEEGDGVQFSVSDSGVGIRVEDMGKLFIPFPGILVEGMVRGTGLGLSICKRIVELHSGRIWAESDGLGRGSVFCIMLPVEGE